MPPIATSDEVRALRQLQDDVEPLADFIARLTPKHSPIPPHLQRVVDIGELTRQQEVFALISMPPRHGKTITLAHLLAWRTLYDPACLNFYATFGAELSIHTSRIVRKLARQAGVPLSDEAQAVQDWRTIFDGGLKATSIGGDVTGRGCNGGVIVADDLVKGREIAESKLARDRAWDWLRDDLLSRWQPGCSVIINATRWHEDDPIGRLLRDSLGLPWIHIELPAVIGDDDAAVDEREDPSARALWPEQYPLERLKTIRLRGEHGWWSLYQQRPFPRGGGMFKRAWFSTVDRAPVGGYAVRGWDLAASTEQDSANTAGVKLRFADGRVFVEDVVCIKGTPHEVEQLVVATAKSDGVAVVQDLPQDPGQAGKAQKSYLASKLHGYDVRFSPETGSKELRAEPFAAQAQALNVMLVRGNWNDAYLDEIESFPAGRLRDRVDATSRAYAALVRASRHADPVPGRPFDVVTPKVEHDESTRAAIAAAVALL